ncbi:hypothetical protein PEPS_34730 (plasmid) [Persicobacter psychrovividus]|uniref:Uncharacterized protein n=1 Tax=Persicobacter psychrovividus TaxID=387638 RepID=A0ABM7VJM6_9BACT|nr:hypothetical protein PEPS_34730 [Persicobacter psychrovividus]
MEFKTEGFLAKDLKINLEGNKRKTHEPVSFHSCE